MNEPHDPNEAFDASVDARLAAGTLHVEIPPPAG